MTNSFLRVSSPVLVVMALLIAGHMAALFLGLPEIYLARKFWMSYLFYSQKLYKKFEISSEEFFHLHDG